VKHGNTSLLFYQHTIDNRDWQRRNGILKIFRKKRSTKYAGQELLVHTGGYKLLFILHAGLRVGEALVEIYAHLDMTQNRFVQRSIEDLKDF
jgi:hypothetical protein